MKILLVRPPSVYKDNLHGFQLDLPLGLLHIAAVLEKAEDYQVEILDTRICFEDKHLLNTYANRNKIDDIWKATEEEIIKRSPDIVGISNQFTAQFKSSCKMATVAKKVNKDILTIVGGPHSSSLPESFLEYCKDIDVVARGEGETTILNILEAHKNKKDLSDIKNIAFRKNNDIVVTEKEDPLTYLDILPFPAYHLVDLEKYFQAERLGFSVRGRFNYPGAERAIPMITSRGCPYGCVFCSIHLHMGRKWRTHSTEYVLKHIEHVVNKYKINHIHFEDDNINFKMENFSKLVDGIAKFNITWDTPNGLRADKLDKELLQKCKDSGCTYLIIGVESAVPKVLTNIINKQLKLREVVRAAKLCKEVGLDCRAFYVIGFPGEIKQDMRRTTDFALMLLHKYHVFPHMHVAYPHIGTQLYNNCKEKGYLVEELNPDNFERIISGVRLIQTEDFTIDEIKKIHDDYHKKFGKIIRLSLMEKLVKHPIEFLGYIKEILINPFDRKRITEDFVAFFNCYKRKININNTKGRR